MKILLFILFLVPNLILAQEKVLESGENKVSLIELYTSQGCSSCPPADEWLSSLKEDKNLFKTYIPMAFHVTYWDFIGWKDVFANKLNDNRQRYYSSRVWSKNSVYTPQFVIDAKEYKQWFRNKDIPKFQKSYGGNLKIVFDNNNLKVEFFNKNIKNEDVYLNIALLGFDYNINIRKGENKHKRLKHDFVVLDHRIKFAKIIKNRLNYEIELKNLKKIDQKQAIVVWLSDTKSSIIQAVGGYF